MWPVDLVGVSVGELLHLCAFFLSFYSAHSECNSLTHVSKTCERLTHTFFASSKVKCLIFSCEALCILGTLYSRLIFSEESDLV